MLHFFVPCARSRTGLRQLLNFASLRFDVRKAQRWCFVFPFTRATETSTRPILPATLTPLAPLQPLSWDLPEKCSLCRDTERLRLKCDTGGTLSRQAPAGFDPGCLPHSVGPPFCVDTNVPGSLPAANVLSSLVDLGSSRTSTAGHTIVVRHVCGSSATPQTSGERSHIAPLITPETGPASTHAPISSCAVPTSVGMSEIRASTTFGFADRPLLVTAAVMCHTGVVPERASPVQYAAMICPGSPIVMCTSTCPGAFASAGAKVRASDHLKFPSSAGAANLYFTPAPL